MTSNKINSQKIIIIKDFHEMKNLLENQNIFINNYLTTYNIKIFNRTITRSEDF